MQVQLLNSILEVPSEAWDSLLPTGNIFLRHSFLAGLEKTGCVRAEIGWQPCHLTVRDAQGTLVAAMPMYLKFNSFGEFVFDWSWADAYAQRGLKYYPKLVSAIPFTPAQGPRILSLPETDENEIVITITQFLQDWCEHHGVESCHLLFVLKSQCELLNNRGFLTRLGCQFHWYNCQYRDFEDFLDRFTAAKRKKLKREKRRVAEAGVEHQWKLGSQIDDEAWETIHRLYRSTFHNYGNYPALTLDFFKYLGSELGEQVVIIQALRGGRIVAASLCFKTDTHLYGRYWGAEEQIADLHFETCYYQGIDYCIQHGIEIFEPGAQGEHKVSRGFEPTLTYSAHYILNPQFRFALAEVLQKEQQHVRMYKKSIRSHLPFKVTGAP